jgi:hypothetical protein
LIVETCTYGSRHRLECKLNIMTTLRVYLKLPLRPYQHPDGQLGGCTVVLRHGPESLALSELSLYKCSFMVSGKCISHFKMLSSVSGTYYGEVALSSPFFFLLFYLLQENSRVILRLLLGFRLVFAPSSMSYEAIVGSWSC